MNEKENEMFFICGWCEFDEKPSVFCTSTPEGLKACHELISQGLIEEIDQTTHFHQGAADHAFKLTESGKEKWKDLHGHPSDYSVQTETHH